MLSSIVAYLASSGATPYLAIAALAGFGWLARAGSAALVAATHSTRAGQIADTLGTYAEGIAETLIAHPPAPADVLAAVRAAAVAQGVAYARANLPATIAAAGVSDATLATMLDNQVASILNAVAAAPAKPEAAPVAVVPPADAVASPLPAAAAMVLMMLCGLALSACTAAQQGQALQFAPAALGCVAPGAQVTVTPTTTGVSVGCVAAPVAVAAPAAPAP